MLIIEYPAAGATYPAPGETPQYGVYEYSTYPETSVLAGQERRSFRDSFPTLKEAMKAYPDAEWSGGGSGYREMFIPVEPPEWFDPANAGETWGEDY